MRRVWLVAQREFLAAVMNKGFVIGLLVMPAIVSVLVMVMPRLMSTQGTQIRGEVAVIDPTGQILEGLRQGLSPEAISRRRAERREACAREHARAGSRGRGQLLGRRYRARHGRGAER